jgi:hypothetical protein
MEYIYGSLIMFLPPPIAVVYRGRYMSSSIKYTAPIASGIGGVIIHLSFACSILIAYFVSLQPTFIVSRSLSIVRQYYKTGHKYHKLKRRLFSSSPC